MSTSYAFKNAVFLLKGPLEIRMNHLVNIIMASQLYNFEFKLVWDKKTIDYNLEDITHSQLFFGKLVDNFDFVMDKSYFYNPSYSVKDILGCCVANGLEDKFPDLNITQCEWLVVENLPMTRNDFIPDGILTASDFNKRCAQICTVLEPSATITGQTSLFEGLVTKNEVVGVYVSLYDDVAELIEFLKTLEYVYFFAISNEFEDDERISVESTIRNTISEDKCLFVMQESYRPIIQFYCLKNCPMIFTYARDDNFLHEVSVERSPLVYTITSKTLRNMEFTNLQKILPHKGTPDL